MTTENTGFHRPSSQRRGKLCLSCLTSAYRKLSLDMLVSMCRELLFLEDDSNIQDPTCTLKYLWPTLSQNWTFWGDCWLLEHGRFCCWGEPINRGLITQEQLFPVVKAGIFETATMVELAETLLRKGTCSHKTFPMTGVLYPRHVETACLCEPSLS